ncbi:hypothetical protein HYH02_004510 [Chlamydomonas schloesseri]|uniref:Uncharacterized protein n=1 Tax=Chlamydomonas schloesseri TaxID=2026947 RepID=A0A835WNF2_9CHLO|nr:hypothetical protein HYH02_004510 [Chlamydomonas schloesseri]|eukprot:KAG2450671.1 hypothetical protein HYH02_004510 [Chlamydomonas schloesseri]
MFPLGDTPAVNAYQLAADDRPSTRSGGARSRPASYVGRCNGLLPAGHHAGALHGSRTISNVAGVTEGAAGGGLFSPPSGSRNGDLASLAGAGACAGPGGGYGPVVRAATFGRSGTDLGLLAPAGPHPGRGRGGGMLYTLGSLGLPGEEDCATFEPLGLEAAEPPMAEPLSPVRTSSGGGGGAGTYAGGGHTAAVAAAHEASSTAGAAAAAAKSAAGPYAGGGSGSGGSGGSGPQSIRKMVSFTASLGPGRGEGLSRHEPIAGNSGASSSLFPTAPPGAADSGLPSGADLSVVVFDVAGLASETAAEVAEAASRAASLLDPTKPAVRRLLPPLWHASQAVCEPPARTVSGGLVLSACNSGGAVAAVGSAGSSQANRRAASLNTPGPGGGASKAAAEMRALLGFAATSPNSTSYDDVDVAGAALSLGMALQPPLVAAGSAFSSDLAAAAAAMAALQTSPGAGAGAAAARAPSGPASALGACMPSSSSSRRWLPPMDGTRFASATGLLTTADLGDAALEPSAGVSSCLLGRLAALSGPGAAGEADGASGSSHGGAGPGGSLLSPAGAARQPSWCAPGASPRPAGPGLPLPPIQDLRVRAAAERL